MSLYKYAPPERLDVLRNLRIRFTQPGAQNDPFEFRPLVSRFRSPEVAHQQLSKQWNEKFPKSVSPRLKEFMRKFPACAASVKLLRLDEADKQSDLAIREELFKELNQRVGILSLSEVPDSFVMWCRYASGHTGFVYEFDDKHPWFCAKTEENDDTHVLRKVSYVDVPTSPYLAELGVYEVLYSKRKEWECEREWRIIRPFVDSPSPKRIGEDIYLFDVPSTAIAGVIVGSLATEDSTQQLAQIIGGDPRFAHVRVGFAHTQFDQKVDIEFWPGTVAEIRRELGVTI